ncbi:hypothetical protein KVF89_21630 [Nocardioides carbamazepini]|uniref:hypothetical protein n=1 Tax=Nocardioides carbamazepini TaxID=2854259 RepID=UPI00214A7851|nr:hypothetical protein [Nocardioides carbamazepini]MCR1785155.1 hypothetical protein [Nocardioides carbamazepini]
MVKKKIVGAVLAGLAAAALVLPSGPPARAAADREGAPDQACILRATTGELRCYPSADALLEAVTGVSSDGLTTADLAERTTVASIEAGLVRQDRAVARSAVPAARAGQADQPDLAGPTVPLASVVTAIFYDGTYGSGAALVMEAASGCDDDPDVEWAWPTLTSDWRNRIRSGTGYARCDFKVWNNASYGGASYGYVATSGHFGALDAAANSVKMR